MSREAVKEAAFTITSRHAGCHLRVQGCRIVIQLPVSVTQGANRAEIEDSDSETARLITRETSPLGHRFGLASLMDGTVLPLPFHLLPFSSSRARDRA